MELVDKNLVIDLIENQKLSYEQASSVLKERFPGVRGLSSWSVRRLRRQYIFKSFHWKSDWNGDGSFLEDNICSLIMMHMKGFM